METLFLPLTKYKNFNISNEKQLYISKFFSNDAFDSSIITGVLVEESLTEDFLQKANSSIKKIEDFLCISLGKNLNDLHKTNFSMEFWGKILKSSWMRPLLYSVYCKYYRLKYVFDNYSKYSIIVPLLMENERRIICDVTEYAIRSETDIYDFQVWSRIVESLKDQYENIQIEFVKYGEEAEQDKSRLNVFLGGIKKGIKSSLRQRIIKRQKRAMELLKKKEFKELGTFIKKTMLEEVTNIDKVQCYMYYPGFDVKLFDKIVAHSNGKILPLPRCSVNKEVYDQVNIDYEKRKQITDDILREADFCDEECDIIKIVMEELPICFLEAFSTIRANYQPYVTPNIKYIISQSGTYYNTAFLFFVAEMHDLYNTELRGIQHGGNYQTFTIRTGDVIASDKIYCWGKSEGSEFFIPSAPNKLNQYKTRDIDIPKEVGILFVGDYCPRYLWRFTSPNFAEKLIDERLRFFSILKENLRYNLVVRFLKQYEYWGIDLLLANKFPWIKLDDMTHDFYYMLKACKCCVTELMATTWLEGLILNVPTFIRFNGKEEWKIRESEIIYVDMLREVGILHTDLMSAGRLLNEVYDNIDLWWQEKKRQDVIRMVTERYWNNFGNSEIWWEKEMLSLLE